MAKVIIVDALTGKIVEREQTAAEETQTVADIAEAKTQAKAAADKDAARQAVLNKLGLTADEAALLG
jgi:hypothetical protein